MIEYLFIIDFLETVIYEGPGAKKKQLSTMMKKAKEKCLSNCKEPNFRYRSTVRAKKLIYDVLARTNEDNIIVGVLVTHNLKKEIKVWRTIDAVFGAISGIDIEVDGLKQIKKELEDIYEHANKPDTSEAMDASLNKSINKVSGIIDKNKETTIDIEALREDVDSLVDITSENVNQSHKLHQHAYWESKKWTIIMWASILIVIGICLLLLSPWIVAFVSTLGL